MGIAVYRVLWPLLWHKSPVFLPHCHKEKQRTRAPTCQVSDSGIGCSHFSVFLCFPEHGSVDSLWLQRPIITLSGSRLMIKLPCTSVSQRTQGPRYSPSSYFPFLVPSLSFLKKLLKLSYSTNSCNMPLSNQGF